jgi:hypothetical protein
MGNTLLLLDICEVRVGPNLWFSDKQPRQAQSPPGVAADVFRPGGHPIVPPLPPTAATARAASSSCLGLAESGPDIHPVFSLQLLLVSC